MLARRLASLRKAIAGAIGLDEIVLTVALTLLTIALWPWAGRSALALPGAVLLWIAMPSRAPFVTPAEPESKASRRKS